MERDYKKYRIIAEAEQDPSNGLFRALIFIQSIREGVSFIKKERQPRDGSFSSPTDAELHGLKWAIDWIDQKP